jgi:hypothetical protein
VVRIDLKVAVDGSRGRESAEMWSTRVHLGFS